MTNSAAPAISKKRVCFAPVPPSVVVFWPDHTVNELLNGYVEDEEDVGEEKKPNYALAVGEFSIVDPIPLPPQTTTKDENNHVPSFRSNPSPPPSPNNRAPKRLRDDADDEEATPEHENKRLHISTPSDTPPIPSVPSDPSSSTPTNRAPKRPLDDAGDEASPEPEPKRPHIDIPSTTPSNPLPDASSSPSPATLPSPSMPALTRPPSLIRSTSSFDVFNDTPSPTSSPNATSPTDDGEEWPSDGFFSSTE